MEETLKKEFHRVAVELYPQGPVQSNIWKRSGGDLSFLFLSQSGRDAWYEALERLFNGGGGKITVQSLLEEMLADFPEHSALNRLQKSYQPNGHLAVEKVSSSAEEINYVAEKQTWFVRDFPEAKNVNSADLSALVPATEIVIFTVTDVELKYALSYLKPLESRRRILKGVNGSETYYVGKFGAFNAVVTKCQMGVVGVGAATLASEEGLRFWQPVAAFMVGIAFGKDSAKQHLGQVLIANSVIPYENQRVGSDVISRGIPLPSDAVLLNRFEHSYDWKFLLPDESECKKEFGPLLSGEKLVDDLEYKNQLFARHPNAVGGEMEGAGFYAAAQRKRVPCILLKSICDWGDGQKHKKHQPLAAAAAASLLFRVLKQKDALNVRQKLDNGRGENTSSDFLSPTDRKIKEAIKRFREKTVNRENLPSRDLEDLSLILFLELVEPEVIEQFSIESWQEMESAFHRAMRRGAASSQSVDESENSAKHEFIRIARKNYLKARERIKISEAKSEFEKIWQDVKNCYKIYH